MTLKRPEPPSTWCLGVIAIFLLVLNLAMLSLLMFPPVVLDMLLGSVALAIGVGLSLVVKPWRWLEQRR